MCSFGRELGSKGTTLDKAGDVGRGGAGDTGCSFSFSFWRVRFVSVAGVAGRADNDGGAGVEGRDDEVCDEVFVCVAVGRRSCCDDLLAVPVVVVVLVRA